MLALRARRLALVVLSLATTALATAQTLTTSPGSQGLGSGLSWTLRSDHSPGLKWNAPELRLDSGTLSDPGRTRLYADWFPFTGHGFRVVGGLTLQDLAAYPSGASTAPALSYQLRPRATTYLGIGYGSQGISHKGLGFYADMGVSMGSAFDSETGLNGSAALDGWRTQQNGWLGFRYLPSVSLGLIYRY